MHSRGKNAAFIWDDRMAWLHIINAQYFAPDGEMPAMRLAKEPLCKIYIFQMFSL